MADEQIIVIKKKSGHGSHHGGAWKVAYADFVTAMMAFFMVMWLMGSSKPVQDAVGGYFRDPRGLNSKKGTGLAGNSANAEEKRDQLAQLEKQLKKSMEKMANFQKLKNQIEITATPDGLRIEMLEVGQSTNFNGQNVFASNTPTTFTSTQASLTAATALTTGSKTTITDASTGGTFVFTAAAGNTIATLTAAVTAAVSAGTLSAGTTAAISGGHLVVGPNTGATGVTVSSNDAVLGPMVQPASSADTDTVYIGDGVTTGAANTTISTTINALSATALSLNTNSLTNTANSQTALANLTAAITSIAAERGAIGASVNRLTAASDVMSDQVQNLQSATNSIENADIGKTVANMTQYNILQSTGMAALQQSNQAQQAVLKLVQ
jgi:flagellin-like hook-associated protein FlgL